MGVFLSFATRERHEKMDLMKVFTQFEQDFDYFLHFSSKSIENLSFFTTISLYNTHFSPYISGVCVCVYVYGICHNDEKILLLFRQWRSSTFLKHFTFGICGSFPNEKNTPRHRVVTNLHWNTIKLEEKL